MENLLTKENQITEEELAEAEEYFSKSDLSHDIKINYRYWRKKFTNWKREHFQQKFKQILYITTHTPPTDYILNFQKQYPDKEIRVLIPLFGDTKNLNKPFFSFEYFFQNSKHHAQLYKLPKEKNNIQIYGVFSSSFSEPNRHINDISFLGEYAKLARIISHKLKPNIVHSNGFPYYLGAEFERKKGKFKTIQQIPDFHIFQDYEPFWAVINIASKSAIKKLSKDKFIQKCITALFNEQPQVKSKDVEAYLERIYKTYHQYRESISPEENVRENIILKRMSARIVKIFPKCFIKDAQSYNPLFYTLQNIDSWFVTSKSYYEELFSESDDLGSLSPIFNDIKEKGSWAYQGFGSNKEKIHEEFNAENFREHRKFNKDYLIKEFSEDRIKTKFTDLNLFKSDEVKIFGYLDSFYESPLIFCPITNNIEQDGVDIVVCTILKLFELNKNIRVIFNIQDKIQNNYINSFIEFFEQHSSINGRWLFIEGVLDMPQFMASSDIIMLAPRENKNSKTLYKAMQYGCIPVVPKFGIYDDNIRNILDDMNGGCGFKTKESLTTSNAPLDMYIETCLKAIHFYFQNHSIWNLIIENCLKNNKSWSFEDIEKMNDIYENII